MTANTPDAKPDLVHRLEDAIHHFADHHKPLLTEALQRMHDMERRLVRLEVHVAALVTKDGPVLAQVVKDAAPVAAEAVDDAKKATGG